MSGSDKTPQTKAKRVVDTGGVDLSEAYVSALSKLPPERRKYWLRKLVETKSPGSKDSGAQGSGV